MRKRLIALLLAALLMSAVPAYADGIKVSAKIPVSCFGVSGTFALYDGEKEIDRISVRGGSKGELKAAFTSLDYFTFTVRQVGMTDSLTDYDSSEYTVNVMTLLGKDGEPECVITAHKGSDGKKADEIIYRNYPKDAPKTGDGQEALFWALALVPMPLIAALLFKKRRNEEL